MCSKCYNYFPIDKICEIIPPQNVQDENYNFNINDMFDYDNCRHVRQLEIFHHAD